MKNKKHFIFTLIVTLLAIAINVFIIVQSSLNGEESTASSGMVVNVLKTIFQVKEENLGVVTTLVRKLIGHFFLFVLSGSLSSWSIYLISFYIKRYKSWFGISFSLFFGLFLAGLTELIQTFTPGRSGQFTDVLIDYSGYILGTFIVLLLIFLIIVHKNKKKELLN